MYYLCNMFGITVVAALFVTFLRLWLPEGSGGGSFPRFSLGLVVRVTVLGIVIIVAFRIWLLFKDYFWLQFVVELEKVWDKMTIP